MDEQNYKWTVVYDAKDKAFYVTGYTLTMDRWSKDGAVLTFKTLSDALMSIVAAEHETSRTDSK